MIQPISQGVISVVGGASSGNGGFVETSGKNILKFTGSVDATAQIGETGDLLLDPIDITITTASTSGIQNTSSTWESDDTTGSSMLDVSDLLASLSSANVTISTQQNSSGQTAPAGGDITVSTAIDNSGNNNNLTLVAGEDISIFFPITMGASGDLTLQAGQRSDIDSGAVLATAALTANDLVVEADTGITIINSVVDSMNLTINQTGGVNVSNTQAFTLTANSNSNNITASTSNGDLSIASVNAGSGTVDLTASGGNILDFTPSDDSSVNITASTVSLSGSTGVGSSGLGDIDTTASTLELSTTSSGNIFVADTDAVTLASSSTSSGGNIDVRTVSGDLTVSSAVTADGSGSITLNSAGNLVVNNVLTSTSGDISLTGATGVTHSAAGDLTTSGSGTITVSATANDVTMADGTVYTAGGGAVSVTGADEVLLGKISNPLGTVAVTATAGDISDETSAEGSSNENIGGTTVTLSSATGVGATGAANDIDIAATTIVASGSGTGGIFLTETDDLAIGTTSTTAGAISISAGGAVTTSGDITAAGGALNITGVDVTNTNTITGDSNGLTIDAGTGTLTSTAGNITNGGSAGSIILAADTDIVLGGGAGAITGGSGNITLKDSSGSVSIGIEGGAGTISLADSDLDEITTSGAIIIGDASSGAITIGGAIQPSGSEALQFSGSSVALNANVTSANADITFVPAVTVGAGVTIDSGAGAGDITFSSTLDGGQAVVLDAGSGGINFNGVVGATALTSLVTTGTTGSISIGQNVTTTGVQTYTGPVTLSGSPTLATTDSLVTFSGDVSGAGALTVTSGTGGLTFGSTIGAGVNITSLSTTGTTGNITLGGDIDSDGTLSFNGPVLLAADVTITTSDDLVTFSDTLDNAQNLVVTTGSGGVTFTGIVGTTPLTSLLTTGTTGTITLGGNVNTTGAQNYVGPVSFNSDIALNVTGGTDSDDVSFGSTVTSTSDSLDINVASGGDVTFGDGSGTDTVSGINALTTNANVITVNTPVSATSIVFEGANTSGDQLTVASGGSLSATGLITIGAANDTTEIEAVNLSGNISSDSDLSGNEDLSFLSNSQGGSGVTFASSGISLNAGTGAISADDIDFAAGSNNPSFLSDGGVSWYTLSAISGNLTLGPVTAGTAINVAGSGGYAISDATLDGISNDFDKVTIGTSDSGAVTIGADSGNPLDLSTNSSSWDLEIIGGASGSFVVGSAGTVTLNSGQTLILNSAFADITQSNAILGSPALSVTGGAITLGSAKRAGISYGGQRSGIGLFDRKRRHRHSGNYPNRRRSYFKCRKQCDQSKRSDCSG